VINFKFIIHYYHYHYNYCNTESDSDTDWLVEITSFKIKAVLNVSFFGQNHSTCVNNDENNPIDFD